VQTEKLEDLTFNIKLKLITTFYLHPGGLEHKQDISVPEVTLAHTRLE
jgi:hypothetical protein